MKIAVLADVHANLVALHAVVEQIDRWQPDVVLVAGDIINRGPRPVESLAYVQMRQQADGWRVLKGNHEEYVIGHSLPDALRSGLQFDLFRSSYWTYCKLGGDVSALQALPLHLEPFAGVRVTHGSMRGIRDGVYAATPDSVLREQIGSPPPDLFCVGHTHQPLIRRVDDTLVVNVGAVGLPFDGDSRPAYAQIVQVNGAWQAEIVRVDYDLQAAERDFYESGFMDESGPMAPLILKELQVARGQLFSWARHYEADILAGRISQQEAVQRYLQGLEST